MKNKIFFTILLPVFYFSACSDTPASTKETKMIQTLLVGGDSDAHGCIGSAGYQWSVLKKECIRAFELKIKFQNLKVASQGGWLLLSDDKQKAEFFGIAGTTSVIFNFKTGNDPYYESEDGKYYLNQLKPDHWQVLDKTNNNEKNFETIAK